MLLVFVVRLPGRACGRRRRAHLGCRRLLCVGLARGRLSWARLAGGLLRHVFLRPRVAGGP
eukprot:14823225-Alexandrium_andersonii.AAC.1